MSVEENIKETIKEDGSIHCIILKPVNEALGKRKRGFRKRGPNI